MTMLMYLVWYDCIFSTWFWAYGSWLLSVSGSRDHSVKLWRVDSQESVNLQPLESKTTHKVSADRQLQIAGKS